MIIAHNHQVTSISQESVQDLSANMSVEHILFSAEKSKYFIGLYPKNSEHYMSGSVKFKIYSRTKKFKVHEELFITLLRLRRGFNLYTIFTIAVLYFEDIRNVDNVSILLFQRLSVCNLP